MKYEHLRGKPMPKMEDYPTRREYSRAWEGWKNVNDPAWYAARRKYKSENRVANLTAKYGVNRPKPDKCEVCGGNDERIVLDHCHERGVFRGWLCDPCNRILGIVDDNPSRLRKLAEYLDKGIV